MTENDGLNFKSGINIISDGTTTGTKIYDNETGCAVGGVLSLEIIMNADVQRVEANMKVLVRHIGMEVPSAVLNVEEKKDAPS